MENKDYPLEAFDNQTGLWILSYYYPSQAQRLLAGSNKNLYRVAKGLLKKAKNESNPRANSETQSPEIVTNEN
jgi:hypothetical protein